MLKIYRIFAYEEAGEYGYIYPYEIDEDDMFETIETEEISETLIQKMKDTLFTEIKTQKVSRYDINIGWYMEPRYKNPKKDWIKVSKTKNGNVEITFTSNFEMEGFVIVKT